MTIPPSAGCHAGARAEDNENRHAGHEAGFQMFWVMNDFDSDQT